MPWPRHGLTPDQAFQALRRYSQTTNTRVGVLAEELTRAGQLPGLEREIRAPGNNRLPPPVGGIQVSGLRYPSATLPPGTCVR